MHNKHMMIDLETLGTTADSVIVSMGAVVFDLDDLTIADDTLYEVLDIDAQVRAGRIISHDTLAWWMTKTEPAARKVFATRKNERCPFHYALGILNEFAQRNDVKYVWSNGKDFDIPMVVHAMHHASIEPYWKFWNHKCFRDYVTEHDPEKKFRPQANDHNALADAFNQAHWLINIEQSRSNPS